MTTPEITPELLRAVADAAESRLTLDALAAGNLRCWADGLEREQADEQRIDTLAQVYADAFGIETDVATWEHAADFLKNAYRSGIRAVLAKLSEDEAAPKFDKGGPAYNTSDTPTWDRKPRQWGDLRDVPVDVLAVRLAEGDARRDNTARNGWRWMNDMHVSEYGLTAYAPYTEILGGAQ